MSGTKSIVGMIESKSIQEEERILSEAERQRMVIIKEAEEKAKERAEAIEKKTEQEIQSEISKYEASAKLKSKHRLLQAKDELIKDVLSSAKMAIRKEVGTKKYDKVLLNLAAEGAIALGVDKVDILLPEGQETKLTAAKITKAIAKGSDLKVKVNISDETIKTTGGLIIRASDGTKWVDNTFEAREDRMANKIRDRIAEILFS